MWKANFYRKDNLWKWGGSPFNSISNSDSILRKQDVVSSLWWISYFTKFCVDRWVNPSNLCKLKSIWWEGCCVFWPAYGCCTHPKAGRNLFFSSFSTFFVIFKAFSVISRLKSLKNDWKWTKKCGFVYSSKLVDMQKLVDSLRGYLKFVFFRLIFNLS